jgi:hypothetical protein
MKIDKEIYMQLRTFQQQVGEWVEVYFKHLVKLVNYLQVKAINLFLITIFRAGLQPYLRLTIARMARNTLSRIRKV